MSRTTRRNRKTSAWHYYGSFGRFQGRWWNESVAASKGMTVRELYDSYVSDYHRDRVGEARRTPPRWFRNMHGSRWVRHRNRALIIRHLQEGCFDSHLPEPFMSRAGFRIYL